MNVADTNLMIDIPHVPLRFTDLRVSDTFLAKVVQSAWYTAQLLSTCGMAHPRPPCIVFKLGCKVLAAVMTTFSIKDLRVSLRSDRRSSPAISC